MAAVRHPENKALIIEKLLTKFSLEKSDQEKLIRLSAECLLQTCEEMEDILSFVDDKGNTLLHLAVLTSNVDCLNIVINQFGLVATELTKKTNNEGYTPFLLSQSDSNLAIRAAMYELLLPITLDCVSESSKVFSATLYPLDVIAEYPEALMIPSCKMI